MGDDIQQHLEGHRVHTLKEEHIVYTAFGVKGCFWASGLLFMKHTMKMVHLLQKEHLSEVYYFMNLKLFPVLSKSSWHLFKQLERILSSRGFFVRIGGAECEGKLSHYGDDRWLFLFLQGGPDLMQCQWKPFNVLLPSFCLRALWLLLKRLPLTNNQ